MKLYVLIFSLLLPFLAGGQKCDAGISPSDDRQCNVYESPSSERAFYNAHNRECCITTSPGYAFAGNNGSNSISLRTNGSAKRTHQQTYSASHVVKGGKIIDINHLHPYLDLSAIHTAGFFVPERYLFSICCLRL